MGASDEVWRAIEEGMELDEEQKVPVHAFLRAQEVKEVAGITGSVVQSDRGDRATNIDTEEETEAVSEMWRELGVDLDALVAISTLLTSWTLPPMVAMAASGRTSLGHLMQSMWIDGLMVGVIYARTLEALHAERREEGS